MTNTLRRRPVAPQLAGLVERLIGAPLPVRIRAWDGSEAGAAAGPVAVIRHRRALRRLLWNPGELGLARAFVAGDLDVEGDVAEGLSRFWAVAKAQNLTALRPAAADVLATAGLALRLGVVGPRPRPPSSEARLPRGLHTRRRDRAAIAHRLRPVQRLLRVPPRPADGVLLRLLRAAPRRGVGRAGQRRADDVAAGEGHRGRAAGGLESGADGPATLSTCSARAASPLPPKKVVS